MSDKEIKNCQNSSKKRPQKNYRGGLGDYSCTPDVKVPLMMQIEKKQHCLRNGCKLLKDIGVLEKLINLVKRKILWFVNFILTQSKFGYLWE